MWAIPDLNKYLENFPDELIDVEVFVEKYSYQPAEPDVGINSGYYEDIHIYLPDDLKSDKELVALFNEWDEYIVECANEELQEVDEDYDPDPPESEPEHPTYAIPTRTCGTVYVQ